MLYISSLYIQYILPQTPPMLCIIELACVVIISSTLQNLPRFKTRISTYEYVWYTVVYSIYSIVFRFMHLQLWVEQEEAAAAATTCRIPFWMGLVSNQSAPANNGNGSRTAAATPGPPYHCCSLPSTLSTLPSSALLSLPSCAAAALNLSPLGVRVPVRAL